MPRPALRPEEVDAFRERLCAAAARRFADEGPEGVSFRRLAADLGCSPSTPYRYFRDKDEILAAVRARGFARLAEATAAAAAAATDPLDGLRRAGLAYLRFARREPHAYRVMFELAQSDAGHPELQRERLRAWGVLHEATAAALRSGSLRGDREELAHLFWAGLHGLAALALAGQLRERAFAGLVEPMIDTLLRGAGAAAGKTAA